MPFVNKQKKNELTQLRDYVIYLCGRCVYLVEVRPKQGSYCVEKLRINKQIFCSHVVHEYEGKFFAKTTFCIKDLEIKINQTNFNGKFIISGTEPNLTSIRNASKRSQHHHAMHYIFY